MKEMLIENQVEVASAVHFLEEAENNSIYIYYADFDQSGPVSEISAVYQAFSDVFDEKAEEILSPHQVTFLLAQFNSEELIFLKTDVSDYTVEGILSQRDPDTHQHSVTFFSCKLQLTECNYKTSDQELLAIVTLFKA